LLPPGDLVPDEDFSFLFFVAEDEDIRDRRVRREGDFSLTDVRALLSEGLGFAISDGGAARFLASHDEKKKLGADYFVSGGAGVSKKFWRPALSRRIKKKFGFGGRRCRGESKKKFGFGGRRCRGESKKSLVLAAGVVEANQKKSLVLAAGVVEANQKKKFGRRRAASRTRFSFRVLVATPTFFLSDGDFRRTNFFLIRRSAPVCPCLSVWMTTSTLNGAREVLYLYWVHVVSHLGVRRLHMIGKFARHLTSSGNNGQSSVH
jgi:hypothetical protein